MPDCCCGKKGKYVDAPSISGRDRAKLSFGTAAVVNSIRVHIQTNRNADRRPDKGSDDLETYERRDGQNPLAQIRARAATTTAA